MFNIRKKKLKKILDRRYEYSSLRDYLRNIWWKQIRGNRKVKIMEKGTDICKA